MNRNLANHRASLFLITTACLLLVMSFGLRSSFGLFVKPLSAAHDWGREVISMALAIQNLFYGIVFLGHQIGSFIGVWLGGWLYDRSGTYDAVWWLGVVLAVFAGIIHWPIQEQAVPRLAVNKT